MENLENEVPSAPIRRKVAIQPVASTPPKPEVKTVEPKQGFHNPKLLTLILLCLSCVGLICFFLVPVYFDKVKVLGETFKIKVKLLEFLSEKGAVKIASSFMLVGYSLILFNSLLNLWHENKVAFKKIFFACNFIAVIASVMTLICGFYLIFSLGYTPISLITISLLVAMLVIQAIAFLRCKVLEEKSKGKSQEEYKNSKILTIIGLVSLLVFAVLAGVQLFGFEYEEAWWTGMDYIVYNYKCIDALYNTSLGTTLFLACCVLLLYHIINNIILLASKKVQASKYGFVSKIIIAILSIIYLVFGVFATIKINNFYADVFFMILGCIIAFVITTISILQAVKSKDKTKQC